MRLRKHVWTSLNRMTVTQWNLKTKINANANWWMDESLKRCLCALMRHNGRPHSNLVRSTNYLASSSMSMCFTNTKKYRRNGSSRLFILFIMLLPSRTGLLSFSPTDCRSFRFHAAASGFYISRFLWAISDRLDLTSRLIGLRLFFVHSIAHWQPALVLSIHLNLNFISRITACVCVCVIQTVCN